MRSCTRCNLLTDGRGCRPARGPSCQCSQQTHEKVIACWCETWPQAGQLLCALSDELFIVLDEAGLQAVHPPLCPRDQGRQTGVEW